jgi:hypothetical protein
VDATVHLLHSVSSNQEALHAHVTPVLCVGMPVPATDQME